MAVDDEVRVNPPELHRLVGQILSEVALPRHLGKFFDGILESRRTRSAASLSSRAMNSQISLMFAAASGEIRKGVMLANGDAVYPSV